MLKFVVSKGHDAFVYYKTVVEADTPEEAKDLARSVYYEGDWWATGYLQEFDDFEIDEHSGVRLLNDGETIEEFLTFNVTAQQRDAVLTGLRLLQLALEADNIPPLLRRIFTNDDAHAGLDLKRIDALCEGING
ncbi:hypothetical protein F9L06_22055 [Brucella anthropi]|uniref:Uncharacterized protein n=1 Tax=Brucella anthropi TaxID=529 RepID=A0A6I0DJ84_BRUAN|nr:hypothetical protein [Brucella anthropi]KAB2792263.1 hypothetical protein F9L06_22055 [Brucella anthropi]